MLTRRGKNKSSEVEAEAKRRRGSSKEGIEICCRLTGHLNTGLILIHITSNDINRLLKLKSFTPHGHSDKFRTGQLNLFPSLLCTDKSSGPAISNAAIIGSNLYACYFSQILTADLHHPSPQFRPIPNPESSTDAYEIIGDDYMMPKLISPRGRLFFFSGNRNEAHLPFGKVYDPTTNLWTPIAPPKEADLSKCIVFFKVCLSEATGEILFYVSNDKNLHFHSPCSTYIYHVNSLTWRTIPANLGPSQPFDWTILGRQAAVKDNSFYWFCHFGRLHSFNWETLQVREGDIVGLDDLWETLLECDFAQMSFFHLRAHIFVLAWNGSKGEGRSSYHITFLKIVKDDPSAYTLGCFQYNYNGSSAIVSDVVSF